MQKNIFPYKATYPKIAQNSFVAPNATLIGDVTVGHEVGIWFNCVVRGDVAEIRIGDRTNIQDGTVIHVTRNGHPTRIGKGVTVGHKAMLHACTLADHCFIGMSTTLMDDVVVEEHAMVAAGSLVTPGKVIKTGQIWAGNPAKYFRDLTDAEREHIHTSEANYVKHVHEYLALIESQSY